MYLADERDPSRVYVFASAAGSDKNPAWLDNLAASPNDLTVEIGSETVRASALVLEEPVRSQIYAVQASRYPGFDRYQASTERVIPVVALTLRRNAGRLTDAQHEEDRA